MEQNHSSPLQADKARAKKRVSFDAKFVPFPPYLIHSQLSIRSLSIS